MAKLRNFKFFKKNENVVIVETGFSVWALFFSWLWYFYNGLWQYGLLLFAVEIVSITYLLSQSIVITSIFLVLIRLYVSAKGNNFVEKKLLYKGFTLEEKIMAADKKRATAQYKNLRSHIIEY